jgi:DNA-binding CsgD family transcriptional regulator
MLAVTQTLCQEGLRFIDRCANASGADCAADFLATVRRIGFSAAACGAWAGVAKNRRNRFFFVDWPADWLQIYEAYRGFEHDLLAIEARRRIVPFFWSDLVTGKLTAGQRALCDAGRAYGWRDVLAVPLHGPSSLQGLVTMAVHEKQPLDIRKLPPADLVVLCAAARTVWERCRTSEGFGMANREQVRLSAREIECLQWAAAGKSDGDIALLVGISSATAHFHIEQAKKRLGVRTRVEAVAVGVLNGLI